MLSSYTIFKKKVPLGPSRPWGLPHGKLTGPPLRSSFGTQLPVSDWDFSFPKKTI